MVSHIYFCDALYAQSFQILKKSREMKVAGYCIIVIAGYFRHVPERKVCRA